MRNPLGIIEAVNPENQLPLGKIGMDDPGQILYLLGPCQLGKLPAIDADRKSPYPHLPRRGRAFDHLTMTDDLGSGDQHAHTVQEVSPVTNGLKSHQIVLQQGVQNLKAPGQTDEAIQGRERDVEEKTGTPMDAHFHQLIGHQVQLIVVDPDIVLPFIGIVGNGGLPQLRTVTADDGHGKVLKQ
jgi:hypothetical protein